MANCESCEELRHLDADMIVNGFDEENCASFQNDTGLVPTSGNNDATDLKLMNDCLIGNMDDEVEAYDVCDWKAFMHKFLPNLWTVLAAIICALQGLWTNVHKIWEDLAKVWNNITNIWNDLDGVHQSITIINQQIATMPKNLLYADVAMVATIQPGYPSGEVNRVNIPCGRSDGYIPIGIVGWNLSNANGSTGVSRIYPFKVKLMGGSYVSLQLHNDNSSANSVLVEATVIYMMV